MKQKIPPIICAVTVVLIGLIYAMTFVVHEGQGALEVTFGRPTDTLLAPADTGIHFRWPRPRRDCRQSSRVVVTGLRVYPDETPLNGHRCAMSSERKAHGPSSARECRRCSERPRPLKRGGRDRPSVRVGTDARLGGQVGRHRQGRAKHLRHRLRAGLMKTRWPVSRFRTLEQIH